MMMHLITLAIGQSITSIYLLLFWISFCFLTPYNLSARIHFAMKEPVTNSFDARVLYKNIVIWPQDQLYLFVPGPLVDL
jgi:hypothetical protein